MIDSMTQLDGPIHLGLDVSKNLIAVGVLLPGQETPRRFDSAMTFMGFTGLVPSEYSTGETVRRGHITKAGNGHVRTQLIESAWAYQHHPRVGVDLKRRQRHAEAATIARSWAAQQRLCGRFRRLAAGKSDKKVVVTAIARELAGFLWAEMTAA